MRRRDFVKLMGMASTATLATSCGVEKGTHKLIPYLVPPEDDIVPGVTIFKSTTCTECPVNCGISAKVHDKIIDNQNKWVPTKLEGAAENPVNEGALCMRGQASLTRLYLEKRIKFPQIRDKNGNFTKITWDEVYFYIVKNHQEAKEENKKSVYLSGRTTGSLSNLIGAFCNQLKIERLPEFEVFSYSSIKKANQKLFNQNDIPEYKLENSDFLLTLGADIFETFVNPVSFAKQFSKAKKEGHLDWIHVEPHASLTGFKSDKRLQIKPQSETVLLAYLIHALKVSAKRNLSSRSFTAIPNPSVVETVEKTGLSSTDLQLIMDHFTESKNPLLIVGGISTSTETGLETAVLAGLLQWMLGMINETINFTKSQNYARVGNLDDMKNISDRLTNDEIGLFFISQTNPIKQLPSDFNFVENFKKAKISIALSDTWNETVEQCDLVIPLSNTLESWGDTESQKGLTTIIQPVLEPLYDSVLEGDVLLELILREVGVSEAANYQEYLFQNWRRKFGAGALDDFQKKGFIFEAIPKQNLALRENQTIALLNNFELPDIKNEPTLLISSSVRTYDGRSRDLQLLQEVPDPISTITYGEWISVSKETAKKYDVFDEQHLKISVGNFSLELPVKTQAGLQDDVFVVQRDLVANFPYKSDPKSGEFINLVQGISVEKTGEESRIPILSGALLYKGKDLHLHKEDHGEHGEKHHEVKDIYDTHEHETYRWAMAIDLESCTGCSACVAACYIENNVSMVGKDEHLMGREMSWLRIEPRYEEDNASFHPVMCQHCDNAPCEPVCPVYAAYHNPEGLNAQIYNRCVGTRYCSNNCPYKVRRFNWFDHPKPEPLNLMSNPDIYERSRGIMEKCSFCIQRIRVAKDSAKDEGRLVQDGEATPACAQTCPADAIVFGNILDPESKVAKMAKSDKAYRELEFFNTKPAVSYLKKKGHSTG